MDATQAGSRFPQGPIIISRTDAIGDVILTLPLAGYLKSTFPERKIIFLGRSYTRAIVDSCSFVDEFLDWDALAGKAPAEQLKMFKATEARVILHVFPRKEIAALARKAGIPMRVGTSNRWFHWLWCNRLAWFSRRRSELHEACLNFSLLKPLGIMIIPLKEELFAFTGMNIIKPLPTTLAGMVQPGKFNLVLHPKSKGSAREWGLENFGRLIEILPADKFQIFITGTAAEAAEMKEFLHSIPAHISDLTGRMSLQELISFINACDGIVACSTGPLHIGAALGKVAVGIYPPIKPMHPGRWAPIGPKACTLSLDKECNDCRHQGACACILKITPEQVFQKLNEFAQA